MSLSDIKPTLLIVDDEQPTRDGLRRAFDDSFDVYVASDYESAMTILESEKVDLFGIYNNHVWFFGISNVLVKLLYGTPMFAWHAQLMGAKVN
ncbi:MAG: hypothetical protein AAF571_11275, partial [Verrucomicrobiota bacterium]